MGQSGGYVAAVSEPASATRCARVRYCPGIGTLHPFVSHNAFNCGPAPRVPWDPSGRQLKRQAHVKGFPRPDVLRYKAGGFSGLPPLGLLHTFQHGGQSWSSSKRREMLEGFSLHLCHFLSFSIFKKLTQIEIGYKLNGRSFWIFTNSWSYFFAFTVCR